MTHQQYAAKVRVEITRIYKTAKLVSPEEYARILRDSAAEDKNYKKYEFYQDVINQMEQDWEETTGGDEEAPNCLPSDADNGL